MLKFYLHDAVAVAPPGGVLPTDERSTTFSNATSNGAATPRVMNSSIGTAQVEAAVALPISYNYKDEFMRMFVSPPLAAQTITTAGTWSVHLGGRGWLYANFETVAGCLYVWRPSTGSVVDFIWDDTSSGSGTGVWTPGAQTAGSFGYDGLGATVLDGDVLIFELWCKSRELPSGVFTGTVYYDGTTEDSTTSNAAYLLSPIDRPLLSGTGAAARVTTATITAAGNVGGIFFRDVTRLTTAALSASGRANGYSSLVASASIAAAGTVVASLPPNSAALPALARVTASGTTAGVGIYQGAAALNVAASSVANGAISGIGGIPPPAGTFSELLVRYGASWATVRYPRRYRELTWDTKYGDVPACGFAIPAADADSMGLADQSVVEVRINGAPFFDNWYAVDGTSGTYVSDEEVWRTFSGLGIVSWFADAIVYPSAWPSTTPDGHAFENATAGFIMKTLIARAKARGALAWLDDSAFTGATTSNATGWTATLSVTYATGQTLLQVMQDLATRGLLSWRMNGMQLLLFNYDEKVAHVPPSVVVARRGSQIVEQTGNTSSENWASAILVVGDQGQAVERVNATAQTSIGRRRELYVGQAGITDPPTLQLLGDKYLSLQAHLKLEETLSLTDQRIRPWFDFQVGDWINEEVKGTLQEQQVMQIAAGQQEEGNVKFALTLGDMLDTQDAKVQKLINSITGAGDTVGGLPVPVQPGGDTTLPSPPTTIITTPSAYRDANGRDFDQVTLTWTAPATNTDASPITDLAHYDIEWTYGTTWSGAVSVEAGTNIAYFSGFQPGNTITFRVRAVDQVGHPSAWAAGTPQFLPSFVTTPATPSTPSVTGILRGLTVTWNGLTASGVGYPNTYDFANVHVGTTQNFSVADTNLYGAFSSQGGRLTVTGLDYATTYYVRLVVVDKSGNKSLPSAASMGTTVGQLSDPDLPAKLITGAKIADGAITTAQLTVAAFGASVIPNGSFEDAATAAADTAGTAHWIKSTSVGGGGTTDRAAAGGYNGTAAQHIGFAGSSRAQWVANADNIGTLAGDIWYVRARAQSSRAVAGGLSMYLNVADTADHLLGSPASNCAYLSLVDPSQVTGEPAANLTADTSLDQWTSPTQPTQWSTFWKTTPAPAISHISSPDAYDGSSFRADFAATSANQRLYQPQCYNLPTSPGQVWKIKCLAKGSGATLELNFLTAPAGGDAMFFGTGVVSNLTNFALTGSWVEYEATLVVPANMVLITAFWTLIGNAGNWGAIDRLEFSTTATSTSTAWQTLEGQCVVPDNTPNVPFEFARLVVAANTNDGGGAADFWIDDVELLPVRGSAYIADASIVDAKINDLAADKITAGTLSADVVVGSRFMTAESGARVEMNPAGIQAFDATEQQTLAVSDQDGSVTMTGQLQGGSLDFPSTDQPSGFRLHADGGGMSAQGAGSINLAEDPSFHTPPTATPKNGNTTSDYGGATVGTSSALFDVNALHVMSANGADASGYVEVPLGDLQPNTLYVLSFFVHARQQ